LLTLIKVKKSQLFGEREIKREERGKDDKDDQYKVSKLKASCNMAIGL